MSIPLTGPTRMMLRQLRDAFRYRSAKRRSAERWSVAGEMSTGGLSETSRIWLRRVVRARVSLAVIPAALLAGCTSQGGSIATVAYPSSITTGSTNPASDAAPAGDQTGRPTTTSRRGGTIKVSLLLPLTGSPGTAEVAKGLRQAGELALVEFDNPNIVLSTKDTRGTADGARAAAEEAVKDGAEIIIGPIFAKEVAAVSPVARAARVPVIAFSSDQSVAGNGTYLLSFLAGQDVPRVVTFAASHGKRTYAALIPEGSYGRVLETSLKESVQAAGGRVVALQTFPANANGMLEPIKQIKEAIDRSAAAGTPVDALFMPAGQDTLPALAPLLPYGAIDTRVVKLIGTSDWDYTNIGREDALAGGWYPAPDPKGWNDFVQRYTHAYTIMPPRLASVAFDAVSLVASLSNNPAGQRFSEVNLTRASGFAGIDGIFRLKRNGQLERGLAILEVGKVGSNVADPAPSSFGPSAVSAASDATTGSGGISAYLPKLNLFGGQAD